MTPARSDIGMDPARNRCPGSSDNGGPWGRVMELGA
jgi:hypothetical protein